MATYSSDNVYGKRYTTKPGETYDPAAAAATEQANFERYLKTTPVADENPYAKQLMSAVGPSSGAGSASSLQSQSNQMLSQMLLDPSKLQAMPGYQYMMDSGRQALERSLAGRGHLNSGNRDIELTKLGQGLAAQQFQSMADMLLRAGASAGQQADQTFGNLLNASKFGYEAQTADQNKLQQAYRDDLVRAQKADPMGNNGLVNTVYRKYSGKGWGA